MELGWSFPKRKKYLEDQASEKADKAKHRLLFQNKIQEFLIHHIPTDLPKYRLENGRTLAAQAQYIATNKLENDFFSKDTEAEAAQQAQHEILKSMLNDKGLFDFFKTNKQIAPIILTNNGYVVDGNRRLCAWRELHATGKPEYAEYSHIDAIILPSSDQRDIDELEARIQVHKDIKADYTWYSTALMLKHRQEDYKYSDDDLATLYEMKKQEVRELIDMLTYAEFYLEDRDKASEYNYLQGTEYAFRQLTKQRTKINDEAHKEAFERIAFCLIDEAEQGRLYQLIPDAAEHLDKIVENIGDELDIKGEEASDEGAQAGDDLLGGESAGSLAGVIEALYDQENYDQTRIITLDVIEGEKIKNKEKLKRNFVFSQIKKANSLLAEAVMAIDEDTKRQGIAAQVEAMEGSLIKIKEWLGDEDTN